MLNNVFVFVREYCYEFMMVEYLLLVLLDNFVVCEVLYVCGVDIEVIKSELIVFVKDIILLIFDD